MLTERLCSLEHKHWLVKWAIELGKTNCASDQTFFVEITFKLRGDEYLTHSFLDIFAANL